MKSWGKKTRSIVEKLSEPAKRFLEYLISRIESLALKHGYGPEKYLAIVAKPAERPRTHHD